MSREALREALWGYKPGYKLTVEEQMALEYGWNAAMKFMAPPRIPCLHPTDPLQRQYYVPTPVHPGQDALAQRFVHVDCPECGGTGMIEASPPPSPETIAFIKSCMGPDPDPPRFEADPDRPGHLRRAGEEHNPHGLVAFYTDAPVKPWGNPEGYVDHPKGCACGVCEQEESPDV